jgi:hypothetical protein
MQCDAYSPRFAAFQVPCARTWTWRLSPISRQTGTNCQTETCARNLAMGGVTLFVRPVRPRSSRLKQLRKNARSIKTGTGVPCPYKEESTPWRPAWCGRVGVLLQRARLHAGFAQSLRDFGGDLGGAGISLRMHRVSACNGASESVPQRSGFSGDPPLNSIACRKLAIRGLGSRLI